MLPRKDIKFPPLTPTQKQRLTNDHSVQNWSIQTPEEAQGEGEGESGGAGTVQTPADRKLCMAGSSYIYAGRVRKPQLLMHLESYVNKELHTISPHEPKFQELKLQVYRDIFGCFIKEFKTYQPLLSAIKKEYETTLAYQQDQIRELEPLRSHLRLVREECDRKIQARWGEEQAEIGALKRETQQLQRDIETMREKEKAMQAVVERLQLELSNQYLQYREECDARKLLIWQLSDLTRASVKEEHCADENTGEGKDPVELQLALKACQEDLTKAQEELSRMKAEYLDAVPRRNWDILEHAHKKTVLQLKTLQGDFVQLKSEYDTLLELHKGSSIQAETDDSTTAQMDAGMSQGHHQIQSSQLKEQVYSDTPESGSPTVQDFRADLRKVFPVKTEEGIEELVTMGQSEPDKSNDIIPSQRINSPLAESSVAALPPALDRSEEDAESNHIPVSN